MRGIERCRDYLSKISEREAVGVPIGVLLIEKESAGQFKSDWNELRKLGKIGYKRVTVIPSDPNYVVIHLSNNSAFMIHCAIEKVKLTNNDVDTSTRQREWMNCNDNIKNCHRANTTEEDIIVARFMKEHRFAEYFNGVRLIDKFLNPELFNNVHYLNNTSIPSKFTFSEIFAGIGGFRIGLSAIGGRCVFASEIDSDARDTYRLNFSDEECNLVGDITEHYASDMPDFDILTAGFPCQSFSIRGEQRGLEDPRGLLYLELVRILKTKQPKAFLFENVSRLVVHDGGRLNKLGESRENISKE